MNPTPDVSIPVDLSNPGQYFACCGLFEIADRQSPGGVAWFADGMFHLANDGTTPGPTPQSLFESLNYCRIESKLEDHEASEYQLLNGKKSKELSSDEKVRKKELVSRIREAPVLLDWGGTLMVDWFLDGLSGGSDFKTWAGQQTTLGIARAMQAGIRDGNYADDNCESWLSQGFAGKDVPFNFDAALGTQSSSLDVGFSFDVLKMSQQTRPLLEFAAFVGLQRFRPRVIAPKKEYAFGVWQTPLPIQAAAAAACVCIPTPRQMAFRLLYRTKYLKSFLPSIPYAGSL